MPTAPLKQAQYLTTVGNPETAFKNPNQASYLKNLVNQLGDVFTKFVGKDTAVPQIYLAAPGGAVYKVTVADDGTLTTTPARG